MKDSLKIQIFNLLQNEEAEVVKIKTEKLIEKNVIRSNSFNIKLNENVADYRKIEVLYNQLLNEKKKPNCMSTFNISVDSKINDDVIPMKFFSLMNKFYTLPCNKFNIIMVFSRDYKLSYEKMEKFLNMLKAKNYISSLHISLDNLLDDGFIEYSSDFIIFKRMFKISSFPYAIVYDMKYRVLYRGDLNEFLEEKTLQEVFYKEPINKENPLDKTDNIDLNLDVIENKQKEEYKNLKNKLKIFNRRGLKENNNRLKNVEIRISRLKKYILSENKKDKILYKLSLDFNEHATIKDKTGTFLDNLTTNFENILNFKAHHLEEDHHGNIKHVINFLRQAILSPLQVESSFKLGLRHDEILGLCKRSTKYSIYNITSYSDVINLDGFFGFVSPSINNFVTTGLKIDQKDLISIKSNFFRECDRKFVVPCYDEDESETTLEYKEGETKLIYLVTTYNPMLLEIVASNTVMLENLKKISKNEILTNMKATIALFVIKSDIPRIKSQLDFIHIKEFLKNLCDIVFVDCYQHLTQWMQYCSLEEMGGLLISPQGEKFYMSSEKVIFLEPTLKDILFRQKKYIIDEQTYSELKEYGRKLLKNKIADLGYSPYFFMHLNTDSEIIFTSNDYETKELSYQVSFTSKLRRKDRLSIVPFINKIRHIMRLEGEELGMYEELNDVVDIIIGNQCSKCLKTLKGFGELQFFCYWCKIHFCSECGNNYHTSETDLSKKLPHEHYLTLIKVNNDNGLKNIETYKFGDNLWKQFYFPTSYMNTAECNACEANIISETRFVCLTCRPGPPRGIEDESHANGFVDFCRDCMNKILQGKWKDDSNQNNHQKMMKEFGKDNHDCETHVYLRIDYQTGNYYYY